MIHFTCKWSPLSLQFKGTYMVICSTMFQLMLFGHTQSVVCSIVLVDVCLYTIRTIIIYGIAYHFTTIFLFTVNLQMFSYGRTWRIDPAAVVALILVRCKKPIRTDVYKKTNRNHFHLYITFHEVVLSSTNLLAIIMLTLLPLIFIWNTWKWVQETPE